MSKIVERAVAIQLTEYLSANDLCLTESAVSIQEEALDRDSVAPSVVRHPGGYDEQRVTVLAMLDLSSAFDCVGHTIVLQRLQF